MSKKVLIISDKRAGHENQSVAFCEILDFKYEILHVSYKNRILKAFSYICDFLNLHKKIFTCEDNPKELSYDFILACGSTTYYAGKYFAKKFSSHVIALMYPKGFRNDFFHIFALLHDNPKEAKNITVLPINIQNSTPKNIYSPKKEAIGIIIGGENSIYKMDKNKIEKALLKIKEQFKTHEIAITSSPRTPKEIEELIEKMDFDFKVIFSKNRINPIPDFVHTCRYLFITEDSTSMISEAVSSGDAFVEILPLKPKKEDNKFKKFTQNLIHIRAAHLYNGRVGKNSHKVDIKKILQKALKCE